MPWGYRGTVCWLLGRLEDPRSGNAGLHDFPELLMIALCAVLCGGRRAVDRAEFAKAKEPFLLGLKLASGVPSHDTFSRVFQHLDPEQFRVAFQRFVAINLMEKKDQKPPCEVNSSELAGTTPFSPASWRVLKFDCLSVCPETER
ncbi:MAG: transposase family protein [Acidobacteriales bacterium]|nr:transposase family protein [Terriglobales bacterium]